ncbi:MAG: hypothetical protein NTY02_10895, partial [Acidobacteria bacterium]|nr:hypothetical protein [Acidobacteriota bacterium]
RDSLDPRLHHLQGKAELVKPSDLVALLQDVHRDKLALFRRHELGAQWVSGYEVNNTYQYVLAREATHLSWLRAAIEESGAVADESAGDADLQAPGKGAAAARTRFEEDARRMREFVETWRPRVDGLTQARHRKMLDLVLGESLEHQRFFEQAAAGRPDLLGRRPEGVGTGGGVLGIRWIE